mmetsp:Transcript_26593/g.39901  ORF Transcript_26593/g.39901 Transcript_26593/m.39901 type:complete len:320 (-) Transcript_26593:67-1026(-)
MSLLEEVKKYQNNFSQENYAAAAELANYPHPLEKNNTRSIQQCAVETSEKSTHTTLSALSSKSMKCSGDNKNEQSGTCTICTIPSLAVPSHFSHSNHWISSGRTRSSCSNTAAAACSFPSSSSQQQNQYYNSNHDHNTNNPSDENNYYNLKNQVAAVHYNRNYGEEGQAPLHNYHQQQKPRRSLSFSGSNNSSSTTTSITKMYSSSPAFLRDARRALELPYEKGEEQQDQQQQEAQHNDSYPFVIETNDVDMETTNKEDEIMQPRDDNNDDDNDDCNDDDIVLKNFLEECLVTVTVTVAVETNNSKQYIISKFIIHQPL